MLPTSASVFELNHTWRTIWTTAETSRIAGTAWLGWNVGHWESDTFVIESVVMTKDPDHASNPDGVDA